MSAITVTVTFTIEANSPQHAEEVVRRYLEQKGVTQRGTVELTNGTEERFGYDEIRAQDNQN